MRKLIYKEDDQGYYFICHIFNTNCELSVEEMRQISYKNPWAGTHSTGFKTFKELMEEEGYTVEKLEEFPKNEIPNNDLEIVIGATGNY